MSIAADGSGLRTVVATAANEHSAKPSPTRDEIVFVSNRDGSSDIFLANLDGSALRSLTPNDPRNLFAPRWSPDGERIVATIISGEFADEDRHAEASLEGLRLVVLERDGTTILETDGAMADWMPPWP
jgi:Tol biopolymer transport system component